MHRSYNKFQKLYFLQLKLICNIIGVRGKGVKGMDNLFIIKDKINEALKMRGMTASDLAKKSGIAKSSISRYLTGENIPRSIAIEKIATALNVSPTWILGYNVTTDGQEIDVDKLTDENKTRLIAYYQALLDTQRGNDNG